MSYFCSTTDPGPKNTGHRDNNEVQGLMTGGAEKIPKGLYFHQKKLPGGGR